MATDMQWEYEDEYDDSYDDLINYKTDGVCEIEEAAQSSRGPPLSGGAAGRAPGAATSSAAAAGAAPRGKGGRGKQARLWVLDGKVYNYKKEGAVAVGNTQVRQPASKFPDHAKVVQILF